MAEYKQFNGLTLDMRPIMQGISRTANKELAKQLQLWARTANRNVSRSKGLKQLNEDIADKTREKILAAYDQRGIGDRPSYRYNDRGRWRRYSNGRMEKAIRDPKTIRADNTGIHFIDTARMDYWAKQWYRLNFGTKGKGSRSAPTAAPMQMFGTTVGRVSLDQFPASEDFRVPRGFWSNTFAPKTAGTKLTLPKGQDAFYAARKDKRQRAIVGRNHPFFTGRNGSAIEGKRFLDEGAKYINTNYGKRFEALARTWLEIKR